MNVFKGKSNKEIITILNTFILENNLPISTNFDDTIILQQTARINKCWVKYNVELSINSIYEIFYKQQYLIPFSQYLLFILKKGINL